MGMIGISTLPILSTTSVNFGLHFTPLSIALTIVGVIMVVFGLMPVASLRVRVPVGLLGLVIVVVALVGLSSQQIVTTTTNNNGPTPAIAIQSVSVTGVNTYTVSTMTMTVPVTANYTSKLITTPTGGNLWFNFTVIRTDTNTTAAIFKLTSSWPSLTNATTGTVSPLVVKLANGTYDMSVGVSGSAAQWGGTGIFSVAAAGTLTVAVHIVLSPAAMLDLKQYQTTDMTIDFGGNVLTVQPILATLT